MRRGYELMQFQEKLCYLSDACLFVAYRRDRFPERSRISVRDDRLIEMKSADRWIVLRLKPSGNRDRPSCVRYIRTASAYPYHHRFH